jgi:hypothetical protein
MNFRTGDREAHADAALAVVAAGGVADTRG